MEQGLPQLAREVIFYVVIVPVLLPQLLLSLLFTGHLPICPAREEWLVCTNWENTTHLLSETLRIRRLLRIYFAALSS